MPREPFFPALWERQHGERFEVVLAWELTSLLLADLVQSYLPINFRTSEENELSLSAYLHQNRTVFAHAVSNWPCTVSLELHVTSIPDLALQYRGTIRYFLLLRAFDNKSAGALEMALSHFTTLQALLNSCFLEAEFTPVRDRNHLESLSKPFDPSWATSLERFRQPISLAEPLARNTSGFSCAPDEAGVDDAMAPQVKHTHPWVPNLDSQDRLIRHMLWQSHPVWIVVRMRSSEHMTAQKQRLRRTIEKCDAFLSGSVESKTLHGQQIKFVQEVSLRQLTALDEGGLEMAVLIMTLGTADPSLIVTLGNSITALPGRDKLEGLLRGGFSFQSVEPGNAVDPLWYPADSVYTPMEAACAFRVPSPPCRELPGMAVKRFRSAFAQVPMDFADEPHTLLLGINAHRGVRQPVLCRTIDRMRHMAIIGMTGTGKSSFMESMILQDIDNGFGLCLVDPHGELVEGVLGKIPGEREDDVILIDPLDTDYPVGLNLLEWKTAQERDLIVDDLYQVVDRTYDMRQAGGPIFENNFRNMVKLLMGDKPREDFVGTIVEFPPLYLYSDFRERLAEEMDDVQVKDFLKELERTRGEADLNNLSPYITSKFSRFINDLTLRRIVGQAHTPFDFREVLDTNRIVLIKLGKGRFGPYVSGFLASQIVSRFKNAAMTRADIPESKRSPFFLYVDEFQNLPKDDFTELLAEARKYRLGLILANQFTGQLEGHESLQQNNMLQSVLGNVGVFVLFRVGVADASQLALKFHPTFSWQDLKELPDWQAYVHMGIEGHVLPPFSIETILSDTPYDSLKAARIREASRKRYGRPADMVDTEIASRRGWF